MARRRYPFGSSQQDPTSIWVSTGGSDSVGTGTWDRPVASLTKAFTLVTATRTIIYILPGAYEEAAGTTWPNYTGVAVIGFGETSGVTISALGANPVITIKPTYTSANFSAAIENIYLEPLDDEDQDGLYIDNLNLGKKFLLNLVNIGCESSGDGYSFHFLHGNTDDPIRISAYNLNEIGGAFVMAFGNSDDRLQIHESILDGGFVITGAYAGELFLRNTSLLTSWYSVSAEPNLTNVGCYWRTLDEHVYTAMADHYDT